MDRPKFLLIAPGLAVNIDMIVSVQTDAGNGSVRVHLAADVAGQKGRSLVVQDPLAVDYLASLMVLPTSKGAASGSS